MKVSILSIITLIYTAFLLSISPTPAQALTPDQVFDKVKDSIVVVKRLDAKGKTKALGSGVLISTDRVATNCHVVGGAGLCSVGQGKKFVRATLYAEDRDKDICLLYAKGVTGKPAQLGTAASLKIGGAVYAVGAPKGLELSLSDGIVAQLRGGPPPLIQTTTPISPGSSGGGLFDAEGRLVGLTTLNIKGGQSLNFAIPVEWISDVKPSAIKERGKPAVASELVKEQKRKEIEAAKTTKKIGRAKKEAKEKERNDKIMMAPKSSIPVVTDPTVGIQFVFIKGGCYQMGDANGEADETPVHEVCVDDFYMAKYETTVEQFRQFVADTGYRTAAEAGFPEGGCFTVDLERVKPLSLEESGVNYGANWRNCSKYHDIRNDHPVSCVSWGDAQAFAKWLSQKSGQIYRLPTEAEWEYAARGGSQASQYWGHRKTETCRYENLADQTERPGIGMVWDGPDTQYKCKDGYFFVAPVGKFRPNAFGLHDMLGNVQEWCQDWYGEMYYQDRIKNNPQGPDTGKYRVTRGSCWASLPKYASVARRYKTSPANSWETDGFRLVYSVPK